jgi:hypothetical protein
VRVDSSLYHELAGVVRQRVAAAERGAVAVLFDEFAAEDADRLTALVTADVATATTLISFRWLRFRHAAPAAGLADLRAAVRLAAAIPPAAREAITPEIAVLTAADPDASGDPADWYDHAQDLYLESPEPRDLDDAIRLLGIVKHSVAASGALYAAVVATLSAAHGTRRAVTNDPADLDATIAYGHEAASLVAADEPYRHTVFGNLGLALRARYEATGDPADLDAGIDAARTAAELEPSMAVWHSGLGIALRMRFEERGDLSDVAGAIEAGRVAAGLIAGDDPERTVVLTNLGWALLDRARVAPSAADVDDAIDAARAAVAVEGGRNLSQAYSTLIRALMQRFAGAQRLDDLREAERSLRVMLELNGPGSVRAELARVLVTRAEITGDRGALDEAVDIYRDLLAGATDPESQRVLRWSLAMALRTRAGGSGSPADGVESILLIGDILAPGDNPRPDLDVIRARLRDFARTGDSQALLDPEAPAEADAVVDLTAAPADLQALHLAGWFLWLRARHLPERQAEAAEHAAAVSYQVYLVLPDAVPPAVRDYFDEVRAEQGAAPDEDGEEAEDDGGRRLNSIGLALFERYGAGGNPADLYEAIRVLRESVTRPAGTESLAGRYNNLGLALGQLGQRNGDRRAVADSVDALRRSVSLSAPDAHYLPGRLSALCGALTALADGEQRQELLDEAIAHGTRGVELTRADHPSRGLHLINLGRALVARHADDGNAAGLREAVDRIRQAVPLLPPGHRHHEIAGPALAMALRSLADATNEVAPLAEAAQLGREALTRLRGPVRMTVLSVVADDLQALRERSGDESILPESIAVSRELLLGTAEDHPRRLIRAMSLAQQLRQLHDQAGEPAALDEAITTLRLSHAARGNGEEQVLLLAMLALLLEEKATESGDPALLEEADRAHRQMIDLAPADHPLRTTQMWLRAELLLRLHRRTGRRDALQESIEVGREALRHTPADGPTRQSHGTVLVDALQAQYELTGDRAALDEATALARAELARDPVPDSSWRLSLVGCLYLGGSQSARLADLEEAYRIVSGYLAAVPPDHDRRADALDSMSMILTRLYEHTGALDLLREATTLIRDSLAHSGGGTGMLGVRNTLAMTLRQLYDRTEDPAELAEAIEICRAIVAEAPADFPFRAMYLTNLAVLLRDRWRLSGDRSVLMESADVSRAAVVAASANIALRVTNLAGLAEALLSLSELDRDPATAAEGVSAARESVRLGQDDHRHRVMHLATLGSALIRQGRLTGRTDTLAEAKEVTSRAAALPAAPLAARIASSLEWGHAAMLLDQADEAERAYGYAVDLMVERAGPTLGWSDREYGIETASTLPGDAAAAAIAAGHPDQAVARLEQSRGVLLGELLNARTDLSALDADQPELAAEFRRVSAELQAINLPPAPPGSGGPDGAVPATPTWVAQRRIELGNEWLRVRDRVRAVPGWEDFLLPPALSAVTAATAGGVAVVVNLSRWRCDALLIRETGVEVVPLPALSLPEALARTNAYLMAVSQYQNAEQDLARLQSEFGRGAAAAVYHRYHAAKVELVNTRRAVERTLTDTLAWLWDTVAGPVVEHLELPVTPSPARLWWCPTSLMALLPLHAAGHHGDPARTLSTRVVSSYTPTLRALAAGTDDGDQAGGKLLIVAMPHTPGQAPLANAARERDHLRSLFPRSGSTVLSDGAATRDAVVAALPHHRWIHFSCHGDQVMHEPSRGGVLLADGLLSVRDLVTARHAGDFAFLSACKTATAGVVLLNESITLASALHYAGYRHVIATLWSVYDSVAADVAAATYERLTAGGRFRAADSARALHAAVEPLRERYPDQPSVWTPFVHVGR